MALSLASILGGVTGAATGNKAALVGLAGAEASALARIQDFVSHKAYIVGQLTGGKIGAPIFDSLQKGAEDGAQKQMEDVTRQATGVSISDVVAKAKTYGTWAAVGLVSAVVIVVYLVLRKK